MDKLEIGGGSNPAEGYLNVDINPECSPDIVGDIRAFFSPDVKIEDYPELMEIEDSQFAEIRVIHFIEHIEWIYQKPMFQWFCERLAPRGKLVIETPDLEWIARSYIKNRRNGQYPSEHPDLNDVNDFVPWVNFKLFSGCSPGDYHHSMFDKVWMRRTLREAGFTAKIQQKRGSLYAVGIKMKDGPEKEEQYYVASKKFGVLDIFKMGGWIR